MSMSLFHTIESNAVMNVVMIRVNMKFNIVNVLRVVVTTMILTGKAIVTDLAKPKIMISIARFSLSIFHQETTA